MINDNKENDFKQIRKYQNKPLLWLYSSLFFRKKNFFRYYDVITRGQKNYLFKIIENKSFKIKRSKNKNCVINKNVKVCMGIHKKTPLQIYKNIYSTSVWILTGQFVYS